MIKQIIHKQFLIKYKVPFFFSKFLVNNIKKIFVIKFIRYSIDVNKYSVMNIYWTFLVLFGHLPKISSYTKQITDKISHSALSITQTFPQMLFYIHKLIHFFLLNSTTDLYNVKKKINTFLLNDNSYYPELAYFPRFFINFFNINIYTGFNNIFLSIYEKVTIFRLLQLPINLNFAQQKRRRRFIFKKPKINKIK